MRPIQSLYAALLAIGVTCVAAAGGFIYADFRAREGAWVDMQFRTVEPSPEQRRALLSTWQDDSRTLIAFGLGAPGAGMLTFGVIGLVLARRPRLTTP